MSKLDDFEKKVDATLEARRAARAARAEDTRRRFPLAVRFADRVREVFGDDVKLVFARNEDGEEIGHELR